MLGRLFTVRDGFESAIGDAVFAATEDPVRFHVFLIVFVLFFLSLLFLILLKFNFENNLKLISLVWTIV